MKNKKEKVTVCLSIDKQLHEYMEELISNKSKYIECLVYRNLLKNGKEVEKIILGL